MAKPRSARAPRGATGACRDRRRPQGTPRPDWVRPFLRVNRALHASVRLIGSTLLTVRAAERCAHQRPIRTTRELQDVSARLVDASARLVRAARELAETNDCIGREPERARDVPKLLVHATEHWVYHRRMARRGRGPGFHLAG